MWKLRSGFRFVRRVWDRASSSQFLGFQFPVSSFQFSILRPLPTLRAVVNFCLQIILAVVHREGLWVNVIFIRDGYPYPLAAIGIIMLARNSPQIREPKELRAIYGITKDLRAQRCG
jgi:hypothetical protein